MSGETNGTGMDLDDINLPLDEIISRKATREQTERPIRGRGQRRNSFSQRRYPPPPPPRTDFVMSEQHPVPEHPVPGMPFHPYYQEPNYMNNPYSWNPRNEAQMINPNFNANLMDPCWMPPPPPNFDQGDMNFRRAVQAPRQRTYPTRGGIRKQDGKPRHKATNSKRQTQMAHQDSSSTKQNEEERCKLVFENGTATILFHDVEIIKISSAGDIVLSTNGKQDGGYLKALNNVLSLINMEILGAPDKAETWKVKDARTLFRYYDGICIKGKGEPSKSRSETVRKAFEQPNPKALEATLASNLAARRLGLAFDPVSGANVSGPHGMTPAGSIRITQDQQLTRTSNYSISFVDQNKDQIGAHPGVCDPSYPSPDSVRRQMSQGRIIHPY